MTDVALVITKTFDATPEALFEAWIDPKQVAQWYGPEGFTNEIHEFAAHEGGTYRLTMKAPSGEKHPLRGTFKTIKKPTKLVFTWGWDNTTGEANHGSETVVTVEFKKKGDKTEMTMTHEGFVDEKAKEMHNQGWSSSFNKLEKFTA